MPDIPYLSRGYTVIKVLEFLKGEPFGDRVLDYLAALRPSKVEIIDHDSWVTCDAVTWRVRVFLTEDRKVDHTEQEVEVELRTADHGYGLDHRIPKGTFKPEESMGFANIHAVEKLQLVDKK